MALALRPPYARGSIEHRWALFSNKKRAGDQVALAGLNDKRSGLLAIT